MKEPSQLTGGRMYYLALFWRRDVWNICTKRNAIFVVVVSLCFKEEGSSISLSPEREQERGRGIIVRSIRQDFRSSCMPRVHTPEVVHVSISGVRPPRTHTRRTDGWMDECLPFILGDLKIRHKYNLQLNARAGFSRWIFKRRRTYHYHLLSDW